MPGKLVSDSFEMISSDLAQDHNSWLQVFSSLLIVQERPEPLSIIGISSCSLVTGQDLPRANLRIPDWMGSKGGDRIP